MDAAEIRSDWVGQTVDGFPLVEWLGGAGNLGVFVTELHRPQSQKAVIKLISANEGEADWLIAVWENSRSLSHPHLIKIFTSGRSQIDGVSLAYVITEYAEEVLSQVIPERALSADETREMLDPIIDALSYLHTKGFVHGHLKPSNVLVVDNQLKLSTDSLLFSGETLNRQPTQGSSDGPLDGSGTITPAMDVWSLGITIIEALTQHPPEWNKSNGRAPVVPESVPKPFSQIAMRCLQLDPASRCTLSDVKSLLAGNGGSYHGPIQHLPGDAHKFSKRAPFKIPVLWMIVAFLALIAIIAVMNLRSRMQQSVMPSESSGQLSSAPSLPQQSPAEVPRGSVEKGAVLGRVLPDVPRHAAESIRGTVKVVVRVTVDASGGVTEATLASPGPSKYFARMAQESAQSWKFKPAQADGHAVPSVWRLQYQFRSSGIEVTPLEESP